MKEHLDALAARLAKMPLRDVHPETGYPVWFMLCLLADARERVESGREG